MSVSIENNNNKLDYLEYATDNRDALFKSTECACVYCLKKFNPNEIMDWCNDFGKKENTAICPYCEIDSIIPNHSFQYNDDLLKRWNHQGFGIKTSTIYYKKIEKKI